mmetsp:Transcript_88256/g.227586  ORF Transcript_88256/g.227586 Transcript_88256/m.227586 type:complete len:184 (-) Transcript_88256:324-875(-)
MVPMVGLAYWPLLLWLPLLGMQFGSTMYAGRGTQTAVRQISKLLVDTPLCGVLKIVWAVFLVLAMDCLRGVYATGTAAAGSTAQDAQVFEVYAAKEGALVLTLNMACMLAIHAIHVLNGESMKLERDRDMIKRQAEQQGQFAKQLIEADEKKATKAVPPVSTMPDADKDKDKEEDKGEVRKRD